MDDSTKHPSARSKKTRLRRLASSKPRQEAFRNAGREKYLQAWTNYRDEIDAAISEIADSAEGGEVPAAFTLVLIASGAVSRLESLAITRPALLRLFAKATFRWPAFISNKRQYRQRNEELLRMLDLGHDGPFTQRGWQPSALSTRAALLVWELVVYLGYSPFSAPTSADQKKDLFEQGWKVITSLSTPEKHPMLAPLGKSRVGKKPKYVKTLHPATDASNQRAEIKRIVWKAFERLVAVRPAPALSEIALLGKWKFTR